MKAYRLVTLVAAVLITVFIARVLTDEKVGAESNLARPTASQTP